MDELNDLRDAEAAREAEFAEIAEAAFASGRFSGLAEHAISLGLADELPFALHRVWSAGLIAEERLVNAIWETWFYNPSPVQGNQRQGLGTELWVSMFRDAGFIVALVEQTTRYDLDGEVIDETMPEFIHLTAQPTEPLSVWRGASIESGGMGMSWTVHADCARRFANAQAGLGIDSAVYRTTVTPDAVLALFGDTREQEVVVDPQRLGEVVVEETIAATQGD